ncbi:hypothetical protein [Streptosporangium subroseum]|uniref:hypothetical protein n=1 Tax=Streptosporangium subroseum TaxID=106412 RepID=UPI00308B82D8|nr:hypothetical protein OHB15_19340 [Streptosporangium subroseum]
MNTSTTSRRGACHVTPEGGQVRITPRPAGLDPSPPLGDVAGTPPWAARRAEEGGR